jgi:two-component system NtrC family sensor kinase
MQEYLPLFTLPQSDFILHTANSIATIVHGTGNINTAVERVTRIVYALKAFSAADNSGAMMLSPLQPSVEKALHLYQSRIHQGIELVCQFESIGMVRCLPDDLVQVWSHLILNALQAMKINGTLTINIRAESGFAVVSVTDTGSGIADDAQNRIFEPFFTTRTSGEGSGLGLAIVKKVIDKHQGRIEVQSNLGVGTTLRVYLPLGQ